MAGNPCSVDAVVCFNICRIHYFNKQVTNWSMPGEPCERRIGTKKDILGFDFWPFLHKVVNQSISNFGRKRNTDGSVSFVLNNVYGTKILADLADKYGVKKFVMISTDKAVNPTNVMGCSKRICEIYVQSLNQHSDTQFVTTRFGNVLGSNGSVIPIFEKQIKAGGPVTVTDPNIIRFFMLIPEACKLVLEAGTMGKGGEIFVFDMGKPVKIADLAKRMILLSGAQNIEIKYTGLRPGEKLYEEVLSNDENTKPSFHEKIRIASVREYDYDSVCKDIDELIAISHGEDDMATVKKMKEIVPEYKSNNSIYSALD